MKETILTVAGCLVYSFWLFATFTTLAPFAIAQVTKDVTITISGGVAGDVVDAYAWQFDYQETVVDENDDIVPNPESKANFALRMFAEQAQANIRSTYKSYMTSQGAQEAQIQADIDSLGITVQ